MCRIGIYGNASLKACLKRAYEAFEIYLRETGKTSSVDDFNYQTLKCGRRCLFF